MSPLINALITALAAVVPAVVALYFIGQHVKLQNTTQAPPPSPPGPPQSQSLALRIQAVPAQFALPPPQFTSSFRAGTKVPTQVRDAEYNYHRASEEFANELCFIAEKSLGGAIFHHATYENGQYWITPPSSYPSLTKVVIDHLPHLIDKRLIRKGAEEYKWRMVADDW
jgi:hypothetical protein